MKLSALHSSLLPFQLVFCQLETNQGHLEQGSLRQENAFDILACRQTREALSVLMIDVEGSVLCEWLQEQWTWVL